MDDFPRMLFRLPGAELYDGHHMATNVVFDQAGLDEALADNWCMSSAEAVASFAALSEQAEVEHAPTRAELEQKAAEIGLSYDGRWGNKRLAAAIEAKLSGA